MRARLALLAAVAVVGVAVAEVKGLGPGRAAPASSTGIDRIVVTFRSDTPEPAARRAHRAAGARVGRRLPAISTDVVAVDDIDTALEAYRRLPDVVAAEVDTRVHALAPPADNAYSEQWNLHPVSTTNRGTLNWETTYPATQGAGVTVAVIDTGFRSGGSDAPEIVRTDIDYDFVHDDDVADDENGHGTHIAGTIAQHTGNPTGTTGGVSVAGVASKAAVLPIKVLDRFGEGSASDTAAAVLYAVERGATVVNLSLGGDFSRPLCDAIAAVSTRALVVAASGNEAEGGPIPVSYPAACPSAVAIGGLRFDGSRAAYSNAGCELAATAPGGDLSPSGRLFPPNGSQEDPRNGILQEAYDPGPDGGFGFFYDSGTSMAAAHAAGAAAVLLGIDPDIAGARRALLASARDLGSSGPDDEFGRGALDLTRAVAALRSGAVPPADALGYWMVANDGGIFSFGDAPYLGSTGNIRLNSPIVAMARTVTGRGYWLAAADGGIFSFGDARFFGSAGDIPLNSPIVGMAPTATGGGYWLVARDGGIFSFGDARFFGSTGGLKLKGPIVGMATDRSGTGYWLVGDDGGIFAFGSVPFAGSTGDMTLNRPIVRITATPSGRGYWMVATDGGIFAFGDAAFHGSTGNVPLNQPIVAMAPTCYGTGYWLVAGDGGVFAFGNAPFLGSTGDIALNRPMVGMQLAIDHRFSQG